MIVLFVLGSGKKELSEVISRRSRGPTCRQIVLDGLPMTLSLYQNTVVMWAIEHRSGTEFECWTDIALHCKPYKWITGNNYVPNLLLINSYISYINRILHIL